MDDNQVNQIKMLLKEISAVSDKYDSIYRKTGGYFNIFDIANISSDEITICRVIHELLNPKGSHFQGDAYLRLFIDILKLKVTDFEFYDEEYNTVSVRREECIPENRNRRIDLVIETDESYIPIEVKIYAGDQNEQCKDYCEKAKSTKKRATMFYLTLDGSPPTPESIGDLNADDKKLIKPISFRDEILIWLGKCLQHHETIKIAPIREILFQLIAVIRRLTNQMEVGQIMEISNILSESKINMKAAIDIEKCLIEAKKTMINKVFKAISEKIEKEPFFYQSERHNENKYDYDNEDNRYNPVNNYYAQRKSTYPGISYKCKQLDNAGIELWFRVEIEDKLFGGFCRSSKGEEPLLERAALDKVLSALSDTFKITPNSRWVHWEYLPDKNSAPDFKEYNEQYSDLFDPEKFDDFINKSMDKIREMTKNIKIK